MKKLLTFIFVLVLAFGSAFSQVADPGTMPRWDRFLDYLQDGTMTFTYKTLTGPTINGTITISGTSYLNIGSSATPLTLTTTPLFTVYGTSASTSGTIRSAIINQVHTGDGAAILEALRVNISSAVQTGSWSNAIVARIAYSGAAGDAGGGLAAALCAEVVLPAIAAPAGSYFAADFEFDAQATYTGNTGSGFNVAYLRFGLFGNSTAIASFEDESYFMRVSSDFTDASGNMWFDNTLRIQIETTDWFIPLSDAEGEYSSAYLIDISNSTDASSLTAASIATDGGLAVTKQIFLGDDLDMSVSGTGVYDITLKTNMGDALSITDGTDIMVFTTTTGSPSILITPVVTITGLLTANGSIAVGDADYIGITSNEIITFTTAGAITVSGANFVVGATATDNVTQTFSIIGDADSDGAAALTSEILLVTLNTDATPTNSTWDFTSTQGTGWIFDKLMSLTDLAVDGTANLDDVDIDLSAALNIDGHMVDIGTGSYAVADADNDLGVAGDLEVDGVIQADGTLTVVGVASFAADVTVSVPTDGGNANAQNTIQGIPKVYLQGTGGTMLGVETIEYMDDSPTGEWTDSEGNGKVTFTNDGTYYKEGAASLKLIFAADALVEDGAQYTSGANYDWTTDEFVGMWIYSDIALDASDIAFEYADDGAERIELIGAIAVNTWTWVRLTLTVTDNEKDVISELRIVQKVDKGAFNLYVDHVTKWDEAEAVAFTNQPLQDGVLSVLFVTDAQDQVNASTNKLEYAEWFVDYHATATKFVPIGDQSAFNAQVLYAHE